MAAFQFFCRSRPALASLAVGGISFAERRPWRKDEQGGTFSLLNSTITKCDEASPVTSSSIQRQTTTPSFKPWRKQLPYPLNTRTWLEHETILTKDKNGKEHVTEVYLLGTHHFSNASARATSQLLETVQPDTVFVELCQERVHGLTAERRPPEVPMIAALLHCVWNIGLTSNGAGSQSMFWASLYSRLCKHYGGEFIAAYNYVESQPKGMRPRLLLGDRPDSITQARLSDLEKQTVPEESPEDKSWTLDDLYGSEPPSSMEQDKLAQDQAYDQLYQAWEDRTSLKDFLVEGIVENDNLAVSLFPRADSQILYLEGSKRRVHVQERDVYMVCKLIQTCRATKPKCIVAIVGAAHLPGMVHLIRANKIGNGTVEPEEVLADILTIENFSRDNPRIQEVARNLGYISFEE